MDNKGMTLVELLITIICVVLCSFVLLCLIHYGNKPVSEMPIWLYWLLR